MSYCLNPRCINPQNPDNSQFCLACGQKLRLKDRYCVIRPLGQGGFGRTFLAVDEDLPSQPPCVVKQFFPLTQNPQKQAKAAEMFQREAVQLHELGQHPQIPVLLAYFTQNSQQYLVQEFIDGQDLGQELATRGGFDEPGIRALLQDLLPVLEFVHDRGVIHRDIKPQNIIRRRRDRVLFLVDFGAAKAIASTLPGATGTVIGSMGYTSPEQAYGKATYASDIFSLGVTCVHLLTGIEPQNLFDPITGVWQWQAHLRSPLSSTLTHIIGKMLAFPVERRYNTAKAILEDLKRPTANLDDAIAQLKTQFTHDPDPAPPPANPLDAEIQRLREELKASQNSEENS
ncbi:MAG: serine/threonine-protein kinase [Jaaginema sp. PMC 1079.18]|nr:serine/threonine-protein kinase [Jaaginema sp. PMC 1080.18]MEC4852007.1 serine/threonine-protein kinase [Jaaginema sp. PMC 1079.18]MEC4866812.1 serine/threonine-protein kinase [Jaaginema sp. PMC 1078.18]